MDNDNSFVQWLQEKYDKDQLQYIAEGGCQGGGCNGMIWYAQTTRIFLEHADDILELIYDYGMSEHPHNNITKHESTNTLYNHLVWQAAEIVAYQFMEKIEELEQKKEEIEQKLAEMIEKYDNKQLLELLQNAISEIEN
jgi:hypothetical protein